MILSFLQSWATHFQINPSVLPAEKCVNLQSRGRTMVERNCVEKAVNTLVRDLLRLLALWVFLGGIFGANNIQKQPKTSKKHPKTINGSTEYIIYCVYIYIELAWWIYSSFSPFLTRPSWELRDIGAPWQPRSRGGGDVGCLGFCTGGWTANLVEIRQREPWKRLTQIRRCPLVISQFWKMSHWTDLEG